MPELDFDVAILGGGMGGYPAAIRASQLGLRVALVEGGKLGGTCLHIGCIPTKALLESSELYHRVAARGAEFGLKAEVVGYDYPAIAARRDAVVGQLYKGVQYLMKKNKIEVVQARGRIRDRNTIEADGKLVKAKNLIVATGSTVKTLPGIALDGEYIVSSDNAVLATSVPESICIIGAGAVGVEFATFYNQLGVKVTLLEALDRVVPLEDEDVSKELLAAFKKAGIDCRLGVKVSGAKKARDGVSVETDQGEVWAKQLLVAVGRAAVSEDLGLEQAGVQTHPNGFIKVDEWMRTSADGIHAIGDVIGGFLLAHAASHEGIVAAEDIAGQRLAPMDQNLITRCTYSHPQIASVGLTEKQAREKGLEVKVGKFPFSAIGRAQIHGETGGFVKIVADAKTGQLLGTHIIGDSATELIAEPALTQLFQGDAWELGRNIHPHPTLSEAVMEAAMAVDGHAIHF
ncbi:MAG: dihydrolipoyl dehydrogenase [Chloroflexi bacterium]|nr:MAG: dihydrolipoyl dehydrogenase [Chloroflexota bacterium]TMF94967.1 MAG: dihydrolipoyl dehydrogenase [Chloroflexota bacterium]